jgi:HEAT repeat protein
MSSKRNRKTLGQSINLTFEQVLDSLLDETRPFHPRNLYRFSDLEEEDLRKLENAWPLVSARRRQAILEDIEELGETNYTLSFEAFCTYTVSDEDTRVRELSVRGLWEYENRSLIPLFMDLLANDSQAEVRAVSATALGKFIYLGEIEEIPEQALDEIVDRLLEVHHSSDTSLVRRRALESLGFSSRDEITNLIEAACNSGKQEWIVSALFAMGRSANSRWADHVLDMLESDENEIHYEAVRAAGELEIKRALPHLFDLLADNDRETRLAAVWSLSQIGGEGVQETLEQLYDETEDEEEADFIDLALENLQFTEDLQLFDMFEISPDDEHARSNGNGLYDLEDGFEEDED